MAGAATLVSISTMPFVFFIRAANCKAMALLVAYSGPYTSASKGAITGGPGGTSTTFTDALYFCAAACNSGRSAKAMSWLLRWR